MRVTKVEIPAANRFGLKAIQMDRLGDVVVLAGKNGAGKSRLLARLVGWQFEHIHGPFTLAKLKAVFDSFPHKRTFIEWVFDESPIKAANEHARRDVYDLDFDHGLTGTFVHFVPKSVTLDDPDNLKRADFLEFAARAENLGVVGLHSTALSRIQMLQDRWWNTNHQSFTSEGNEQIDATERYDKLNNVIEQFIGFTLDRDRDGHATLSGYPIGKAPLSDGQKILLQFCVAIHAQADKLSELIVLMDEPENHLHPAAVLDAIEQIRGALTNGQLWIATHSIPLLAHFDPESIWWMEDGGVQHAGSTPEKVLSSLLGDDDRIARLNDFLGLPAALAANRFAHQCLLPPSVLTTEPDDPQTTQISRLLADAAGEQKLRVLDYGAGRGRLVSALREGSDSPAVMIERIDYLALDPDETHHAECEAAIARAYDSPDKRLFHEEKAIRGAIDAQSVDVVVMCNVLHEIDVTEWLGLFSGSGLIRTLLKEDGFLLVVEDTEMRIGERAHQRGFLVLDTGALKTLFSIGENETAFVCDEEKGHRLQAHLIPARCISAINQATLSKTLRQIRQLAIGEIKNLRNTPGDYRKGRRHAFHVQQLANAQLGLEMFGE